MDLFLQAAIDEAKQGLAEGGIPIGSVLVIDGQIAGAWRRTFDKGAVVIECRPFVPLTAVETMALDAAAKRFGDFLGMPVVLR